MARTTAWAARCRGVARPTGQALFGIVQGGIDTARRLRHVAEISPLDFDGHALGGLVGRRADRRDVPRARRGRAHAAGRPAALPDGRRHAGRPRARHRRRRRHVRLRDADPQRAQRLPVHVRAARSPSRTRSTGRTRRRSTPSARARPAGRTRAPTCDTFTMAKEILYAGSQPCTTSRSTPATCAGCAIASWPTGRACLTPSRPVLRNPTTFRVRDPGDPCRPATDPHDAPDVRGLLLHPDPSAGEEAEGARRRCSASSARVTRSSPAAA